MIRVEYVIRGLHDEYRRRAQLPFFPKKGQELFLDTFDGRGDTLYVEVDSTTWDESEDRMLVYLRQAISTDDIEAIVAEDPTWGGKPSNPPT